MTTHRVVIGNAEMWHGDCRDVLRRMIADGVKVTEAELAYCAGVIDSDGTIGIKRGNSGVGKDCTQPSYGERITVKQVEPHAIDLLHRVFGGARRVEKASLANGRPLHTWQVTHLKAVSAATALLPHLRIKRAQAENLLSLRPVLAESVVQRRQRPKGQPGPNVRAPHLSASLEAIYSSAKELNRVGR